MRHIRPVTINPDEEPVDWRSLLRRSRIPERYWECTPEAIESREVRMRLAAMKADYDQWGVKGAGFYLHGPFESGKSSVAAILAMHLIQRLEQVLWVGARDIPSLVFAETEEWKKANKQLRRCDLLIIDDFGSQNVRMDGPGGTAFESALRLVYDRRRSVVMTANWGWDFLHTKYCSLLPALMSIVDRMMTPAAIINDQWGDERRRNGIG